MSRTRYHIFENEQEYPYFMTCTFVGWLAIFTRPEAVQIILEGRKGGGERGQVSFLCAHHAVILGECLARIAVVRLAKSSTF